MANEQRTEIFVRLLSVVQKCLMDWMLYDKHPADTMVPSCITSSETIKSS